MVIKVAEKAISLRLLFENSFSSLTKYQTNDTPEFFINSYNDKYDLSNLEFSYSTKFYDMYTKESLLVQYQKNDFGEAIGVVEYNNNVINVYCFINDFLTEYLLTQYAIVYIIKKTNSIFMHGSSFSYNGKGIMITAKSGTGKSTHVNLWRKYENITTINDDKNIITLNDEVLYVSSSPWSGKHQLDNNVRVPLKAIVFIYQSPDNKIRSLEPFEAFKLIMPQVLQPDKDNKELWNIITDKLLELPCYYLGCNMDKSAMETLKNKLMEDNIL